MTHENLKWCHVVFKCILKIEKFSYLYYTHTETMVKK